MKILFITNVPSPYRVDFFNELGKTCELTVCFERHSASDRDSKWVGNAAVNFREVYTEGKQFLSDKSIGLGIIKVIKSEIFDKLVICGYSSPAVMLAIAYCKVKHIPYYIESDGGFNKPDKLHKAILKRFLLKGAKAHFTTCEEHINYFTSLGIEQKSIYKYPFSSVSQQSILKHPLDHDEKMNLRLQLGIKEEKMVISVGQFIPRKGYDILLQAAKGIASDVGVYIVGGKPTPEYSEYKKNHRLDNVHFVDFMKKDELKKWYMAADCFALPTREDIWGLVVNEAMACGLPIITTDKCIAGTELVENGKNGYIVPVDDWRSLCGAITDVLDGDSCLMSKNSLETIRNYTIEKMAEYHMKFLK